MQILDYLETGTLFGWKNVENGYYFLPAEMETFGFYYCGQDESGAWGELYYEELTFTEDDLCDPKSAPNSGFINGKSAVTPLLQSSRIRPDTPSFTKLIHFVSRQIWQFGFLFLPLLP